MKNILSVGKSNYNLLYCKYTLELMFYSQYIELFRI